MQADVEEHIGGPLGEVEPVLSRFQDALAYVHDVGSYVIYTLILSQGSTGTWRTI